MVKLWHTVLILQDRIMYFRHYQAEGHLLLTEVNKDISVYVLLRFIQTVQYLDIYY